MTSPLRVLAVAALGALMALGSGCGGGGDTADRVAGLTPDEILRQSAEAAKGLTAFQVAVDATLAADVAPGTLPKLAEQALEEPVTISGEGPVNGNDASFDLDATIAGLPPLQANVTKVAGRLFVGVLLTDYKVDVDQTQIAAIVPARFPRGMLAWATSPKEVGREKVGDASTVHLTATIDTARALTDLAPVIQRLQGARLSPATRKQLGAAVTTKTIDLWIGVDDLLPRRLRARLDYAGGVQAVRALKTATLDINVNLSKIGDAVPIPAPTTTEVLDLERLQALAGR